MQPKVEQSTTGCLSTENVPFVKSVYSAGNAIEEVKKILKAVDL